MKLAKSCNYDWQLQDSESEFLCNRQLVET